ncbi:transcriptional regulator [Halorubrum sp. AD140]|uniref:RAD55 family ATPase n=1 Tax=Halorubrum sp. AD140 TaxID=3050073 RepID=UPI002ACC6D9E|nr:transcriptional regulator [Halorubrum sp. AD140]MDZ5810158.1 transcriptional regulator [Halorubrum sp. AD140]
MEPLSTGIPVLDREFDGGVPSGSVVALTADPASQSELIVDRLARVRECRYLTTVRSVDAVESGLSLDEEDDDRTVVRSARGDDPFASVLAAAADLPDRGTIVVDSVDPLEEHDRDAYVEFLGELRQRVVDVDGLAVMYALKGDTVARNRGVTEQIADVVFDLRTTVTGTEIANRLVVPKFRGGAALEEPLKLKLTDSVSVDTSRDIA